ncbi:hypothetical protein QR680_013374 [Steinernema hermaphroditum]|uniref:LIM zinc-binding domain-containing protein n=1 Tax=Steinernema hermaphroditum TaxID=289476 RepID=A0AA39M1G1_9BILA|nr:hypothetical protein QR680_013374 [Steinernema hermaphroditum]
MPKKHCCPQCAKPIGLEQAIFANGKLWHVKHFMCTLCAVVIGAGEGYHRLDEKSQACDHCFEEHFAPKCHKCRRGISSDLVVALESSWHRECLRCCKCEKTLRKKMLQDAFEKPLDRDCFWGQRLIHQIVSEAEKERF